MGKSALTIEHASDFSKDYPVALVQSSKKLPQPNSKVYMTWSFADAVAWIWPRRPGVILVDEYTQHEKDANMDYVLTQGRNVGIGLEVNSQFPVSIPPRVRGLADRFYLFQLTEETSDLIWVKRNFGEQVYERVRTLQEHEYIRLPQDKPETLDEKKAKDAIRSKRKSTRGAKGSARGKKKKDS
jgi:hypothetical protein